MSFNVDFDQLFALRVFLQDDHENECDIITELRYELLNMGLDEENIPNILKEFYDNYGINISLEVINEAIQNTPNNNQFQQIFNFINNNIQETLNAFQQNQPPQVPQEEETEEHDIEHDEENDEENDTVDNETIPNPNLNPNLINLGNGFGIQLSFLPTNLLQQHTTNPFTDLINIINTSTTNNYGLANNFTDVVTTLEEEDLNNLKKFKTDKILEEKCSICMTNIIIDEEVCELPCKHNFHNECVQPWFKQYNYKCPICRMEVGKPKHNI